MPEESRRPVKLDFTTGLIDLPRRGKADEQTTKASVAAGREVGFTPRDSAGLSTQGQSQMPLTSPAPADDPSPASLDGRRLRSRGANTQFNLKVTAEEKQEILREASRLIQDPNSPVSNIGEFIVMAVALYKTVSAAKTSV